MKNLMLDRTFGGGPRRGGFRLHFSSGTADPREFQRRNDFLSYLWATGRELFLHALRQGEVTLEELMSRHREGKLGYSMQDLSDRLPLWSTWEEAIASYRVTHATRTRYRAAVQDFRRLGLLPDGALVRDLAMVPWSEAAEDWSKSAASWNHIRRAVGKFLTHMRGYRSDFRREVMAKIPSMEEKPHIVDAGEDYIYLRRALAQVQQVRPEFRPVYEALLLTGLRVSEYLRMEPRDLLHREHAIVVRPSDETGTIKNSHSARIVSVPPQYWDIVVGAIPYPVQVGRERAYWWIREVLVRACDEAGVPRLRLHGLRHLKIRMALEGGAPLNAVAEEVGHKNVQQTAEYALTGKRHPVVASAVAGVAAAVMG